MTRRGIGNMVSGEPQADSYPVTSLRRLHAAGQPIAEMIIDTIGIAALCAFMAHSLLGENSR